MRICPTCNSKDIVTEKRIDGNSLYKSCGREGKTSTFQDDRLITPEENRAKIILRNQKYKKQAIEFIKSNGWKSEPCAFKCSVEYISFDKDGCYGIDISDDEIVLIDETGDFMHISLGYHSRYTLLGVLIYHRQLAMSFKQW